jgi:hypothetical protein
MADQKKEDIMRYIRIGNLTAATASTENCNNALLNDNNNSSNNKWLHFFLSVKHPIGGFILLRRNIS